MTTRQDRADRDAEIMHMHASGLSSTAIAERVGVSRTRVWQITSGYYDRTESANPTTAHRWTRPDGSFDVLAWCRHLDNQWNVGGRDDLPLTRDHVVPLVDGGTDAIDNIQPLCGPCNSSKGTKTMDYRLNNEVCEVSR